MPLHHLVQRFGAEGENEYLILVREHGTIGEDVKKTLKGEFEAAGAKVFGISKDTVAKHDKFRDKHELGIPLLSDAESDVCEQYGVWKEKSMYGKKFMGIERTTVLIGGDGKVVRVWPKVKVPGHAEEVLEAVKAL